MKQPCLVFDLDDTLYLERDYVRSGFRAVSDWLWQEKGIHKFGATAWELFERGCCGNTFDRALTELGVRSERGLVRELVMLYREHTPRISLAPDAEAALESLWGECPVCLITDGHLASQERKIQALGLARRLNAAILTDRWGRAYWKPHARAFRAVEQAFPPRCYSHVYIGDNPLKDFDAPAALKWVTVRVRRSGGLHAAVPNRVECPPDTEILDLRVLPELLRRCGSPLKPA